MPVPAQKRGKTGPGPDAETLEDVAVWAKIKMVAGVRYQRKLPDLKSILNVE
jgi:hypothetical protein